MEKYQTQTDEQLIAALRGGEQNIMDYILAKYKPLVLRKANAMYLIGGETDDLIQEGMIGLFKAIRDYREEREASFFHFAELCITRQLYHAVEASNRKKHAPLNSYVSFDASMGEGGVPLAETLPTGTMDDPEQMVIAQENLQAFWQEIRECLSGLEREVLDGCLAGANYRQIAEEMGRSPKVIDNALSRIKRKIREHSGSDIVQFSE